MFCISSFASTIVQFYTFTALPYAYCQCVRNFVFPFAHQQLCCPFCLWLFGFLQDLDFGVFFVRFHPLSASRVERVLPSLPSIVTSYIRSIKNIHFSDFTFCCLTLSLSLVLFPARSLLFLISFPFFYVTFLLARATHYAHAVRLLSTVLVSLQLFSFNVCFFHYFTTLLLLGMWVHLLHLFVRLLHQWLIGLLIFVGLNCVVFMFYRLFVASFYKILSSKRKILHLFLAESWTGRERGTASKKEKIFCRELKAAHSAVPVSTYRDLYRYVRYTLLEEAFYSSLHASGYFWLSVCLCFVFCFSKEDFYGRDGQLDEMLKMLFYIDRKRLRGSIRFQARS